MLHHFNYFEPEAKPKYMYYISQFKYFEYQNIIYKDIEEKTTFTKLHFKEIDYDKRSILSYNDQNLEI